MDNPRLANKNRRAATARVLRELANELENGKALNHTIRRVVEASVPNHDCIEKLLSGTETSASDWKVWGGLLTVELPEGTIALDESRPRGE